LLPLALWSTVTPVYRLVAAALAVTPVVIWTVRYGPRLSST
jgi:lambda repressor-like predicted transcriptional regulator